jgi:hypothetical protein
MMLDLIIRKGKSYYMPMVETSTNYTTSIVSFYHSISCKLILI